MELQEQITLLTGAHNDAALEAVSVAGEKIAEVYGDEGIGAYEQLLDAMPVEDLLDTESSPEKTASEYGIDLEKVAEAEIMGRLMFHAFRKEAAAYDAMVKSASDELLGIFVQECTEE